MSACATSSSISWFLISAILGVNAILGDNGAGEPALQRLDGAATRLTSLVCGAVGCGLRWA